MISATPKLILWVSFSVSRSLSSCHSTFPCSSCTKTNVSIPLCTQDLVPVPLQRAVDRYRCCAQGDPGGEDFKIWPGLTYVETVNNVGWASSLAATQPSYEKRRFMDRDSRRNLLALNYAVMYLVENKLLSESARVINIAGISCNPATALTGNPHWKCLALFMQKWYNWASRALILSSS